jgi:hypothetical protein
MQRRAKSIPDMSILHAGDHLALVGLARKQVPLGMGRTLRRAAGEEDLPPPVNMEALQDGKSAAARRPRMGGAV